MYSKCHDGAVGSQDVVSGNQDTGHGQRYIIYSEVRQIIIEDISILASRTMRYIPETKFRILCKLIYVFNNTSYNLTLNRLTFFLFLFSHIALNRNINLYRGIIYLYELATAIFDRTTSFHVILISSEIHLKLPNLIELSTLKRERVRELWI